MSWSRRFRMHASLRACRCMHRMLRRQLDAEVNMCAREIHTRREIPKGDSHSRVSTPSWHYRHLNPVYIDGYPAKIRLGWRLAYDVAAAGTSARVGGALQMRTRILRAYAFPVPTVSIKGAPRRAIACDFIGRFRRERKAVRCTRVFSSLPTHFRMLHFQKNKSETSARNDNLQLSESYADVRKIWS